MPTETEELLLNSSYKNIPGVLKIDSGKKGPSVAIFAMTHGNEVSGFEALKYLISKRRLLTREIRGKIFLIVHNLEAFQEFKKESAKRKMGPNEFRYININLNRIFSDDILKSKGYQHMSEVKRAKQMIKIIPEFDYILDLHSTSKKSEPMLLYDPSPENIEIANKLSVERHIIGIFDYISDGMAMIPFAQNRDPKKVPICMALESGSHYEKVSVHRAKYVSAQFLEACGSIDFKRINQPTESFEKRTFQVVGSIQARYHDFNWARNWQNFQDVKKGTLVATENGKEIKLKEGYTFLIPTKKPQVGADAVYLAKILLR